VDDVDRFVSFQDHNRQYLPSKIDKEADMNEDFATRAWADQHKQFSKSVASAVHTIMDAMNVLQAKQYDAPWSRSAPRSDCTAC
jgi:hypothetical protein